MKESKAYPYLKALLDGLIEAAPNWMKAPGKFVSSLSEQLQKKNQEQNKQLEKEIKSISEKELRELIKEAGYEQKQDIELIVGKVQLIPEILQTINYRFDKVDGKLEQIESVLERKQSVFSVVKQEIYIGTLIIIFPTGVSAGGTQLEKQKAIIAADIASEIGKFKFEEQATGRDIYQAGRDIVLQLSVEKEREKKKGKLIFPFGDSLNNQTPPEENFVGRKECLKIITDWYKNPEVRIGALIGWGGVGKSALVRKWYDRLEANKIRPDGIFWWGFYRNASLEQFLNTLLRYVSDGQIEPETIKGTWEKVDKIKEYISQRAYLIILDGLEQMQEGKSGDKFGKMAHRECTELLHYLADTPKASGLCLITTRFPLKDLDEWHGRGYENLSLVDLSIPDALLMLKKRGIIGSDGDMREVIERYKGHTLSLMALSGYLNRYYGGDIKQAPEVEFVLGDKDRFNKLLCKNTEKMSEGERVFLNIFSLFRQKVTENDFAGVFWHEIEGTKFNDVLITMGELEFKYLISNLVYHGFISYDAVTGCYNAHPLIKNYFESDFNNKDKKLCHKRIYQYFGEYVPERPETLEEMQPLFEQVYHGCAAGLYDEVYRDVYWEKIQRREEYFITQKLGAWETSLSLVKTFFLEGDLSQMPRVSNKRDQSWLLAVAGLALLATGRPKEAQEPLKAAINLYIEDNQIAYASRCYQNLADLRFRTSEFEAGLGSAEKALGLAEKAKHDDYIRVSKAYLGWGLYLLGKTKEAEKQFREADELNIKIDPDGARIYGLLGVFYADFLISMERIDEAFELARQNLKICENENWPDDISRCYRCLCAIERIKGNKKQAENHFQDALDIARKVGVPDLEIEALIERSRLWLDMGKYEDAISDAEQVLKICERTGFGLYEPGAEIVLARAYLAQKGVEKALRLPRRCSGQVRSGQAETYAQSAYEKASAMKYRWAEGDAAHLLGEIALAREDKKEAQQWLKKAIKCRKEIKDPKVKDSERILNT